MRVIAVINQKGGVGKTTTTFNLAHALTYLGKRVLTVDMDPQAHLTASFGAERHHQNGIDEVLMGGEALENVRLAVREGIDLVPAGARLAELEQYKEGGARRGWLLHEALSTQTGYDVVLIDCPPSSGLLTMNALLAAREILVPVSSDYLSLHGLSRLMAVLARVEDALKHSLKRWYVLTRYQDRRRLAREVRDKLQQHFPGQVLATPIRETVGLAESPSFGKTIFEYQHNGLGAQDYHALAADLLYGRTL